ncbi:cytochrome P450 [Bacillus mesophilus]|uniref:Cytochrome P450 n=1 Tax=Bacillus mesophilus TaxID=1808955 RepID=A0A6M0Q653_9BACI|nr:cytochrome P450 [Bacillus mesophilus]MBM7660265.1 cytochrome P450 [Bacillus mesophilus]NEY70980.1 cytochrome P450 [Bacillus mesophilus]
MIGPFNPLSAEFQEDRYEVLKKYREQEPVHGSPEKVLSGRELTRWTLTRYDDAVFVLKDSRFVKELKNVFPDAPPPPIPSGMEALVSSQRNQMLFRDPPDHTRLRRLVTQAFTPRIVEQLNPRIKEIAVDLLSDIKVGSEFDVVSAFAFPLPVIVIAEMLGVPHEDRDKIKSWSQSFIKTIDYKPSMEAYFQGNQATIEFRDYFRDIIRERAKQPKTDLISGLIQARDEGGKLSEDELLDMCILLLVAGHETTVNLIANTIYLLNKYPNQQELLRNQPELMPNAIEEVLRFEPPVQVMGRQVAEELTLRGKTLHRGDFVNIWISSANRDENQFENPDVFNITRKDNRHLAFGQGHHFCLGAPLARKEGEISIATFLECFPHMELGTDHLEWTLSPLMRSLKSLPVRV